MKGTRHSEEQIITILKQGEAGVSTAELCRQHGIADLSQKKQRIHFTATAFSLGRRIDGGHSSFLVSS
jgi:putative transposase